MALVIPAGYAQGVLHFALVGDNEELLTTVGLDTDIFNGSPDQIAAELAIAWSNAFPAAAMTTQYSFLGASVRVGAAVGPPLLGSSFTTIVGTDPAANPPQNCAILVKKRSGLGGRANTGRMFLPPIGLSEGSVSAAGVIAAASVVSLQNRINTFATGGGYVILHDSESPALTPTPITTFIVDNRLATQRRRLR